MLLGRKFGEIVLKLVLVRIVPIATALALIYAISVVLLEKRVRAEYRSRLPPRLSLGSLG
jgi:hypothetical protein